MTKEQQEKMLRERFIEYRTNELMNETLEQVAKQLAKLELAVMELGLSLSQTRPLTDHAWQILTIAQNDLAEELEID